MAHASHLAFAIQGGLQGEFGDLDNKNLKKNISKCRSQISGSTKDHFAGENEVCEISQTHKKGCEITSQQKADFAALRSWLSACSVRLPTAVTPSFQLQIVHRLNHWISEFLRFLFTSPPCIPDLLIAKDFKALVLHVSELSIALPWIPNNSPQSHISLVIKKLSKHQNLTQID
uniref:Uncharacterized protein n=1 Tax=Vitis vinifera TaxID=29760 RepID=A5BVX2_VITVI|nr:hypothetical protein VITISV_018212 [Vitis vinifera]